MPSNPVREGGPVYAVIAMIVLTASAAAQVNVLTHHYDIARRGQNTQETILTPTNVNSRQFGKLFSFVVDGYVYAQPLYVSNVSIPNKGTHNVLYVATEHDSIYALDADTAGPPLWQTGLIGGQPGVSTVSSLDLNGCGDLVPEVGITGTPVIDLSSNTMFLVARTKEGRSYVQRLHALDITTGQERPGSPVVITASIAGTGAGSYLGIIEFNPFKQHQRAALLLENGIVHIAWGSHCDSVPYHGWMMGYDAQTLTRQYVFNASPNGVAAALWQSGAGPAADGLGSLYAITGNGTFDANSGGIDYGDTALKLSETGTVGDYFTPSNEAFLDSYDLDFGSGGPVLLPDQPGTHPHEMVACGKFGTIYVLDRDNMGTFHAVDAVVQSIPGAIAGNGELGIPAYWNSSVYYFGSNDVPKEFGLTNTGTLTTTPVTQNSTQFNFPGATPVVSSNGTANGIVWTIEHGRNSSSTLAVLHAYDATDLSHELYNSRQVPARDFAGYAVKFTPPIVANGKVYVAGAHLLTVFGLL